MPIERYTERSKRKPPGETGRGWPPKPDESQHNPPKSAYKGDRKKQHKHTPNKTYKTRAGIIRRMNGTQRIPDKNKDPDSNKMKWKYG